MKKYIFFLFIVLPFLLFSQTSSIKRSAPLITADPRTVGMSAQRLSRIDSLLNKAMLENHIPGAVALVARKGKIVYFKSFGKSNVENNTPFNNQSIFRIASQSKAITTTAAMMLWEEGKFNLDQAVSDFIPEFKNPQILDSFDIATGTYTTKPAKKEITVRQLITHTSGIGYGVIDGNPKMKAIYRNAGIVDLYTTENITIGENIKKLAKLPLHHEPGAKYTYSEGLDVLGYLIEIWSGMIFDQFLRKRLFTPLGMNDTYFYLPGSHHSRLVDVQTKNSNNQWIATSEDFYDIDYPRKGAMKFYSGGAGLSSTAKDYATFLQMYLNGGELNGTRILSRTTINFMMQNQVGNLRGAEAWEDFGLGFGLVTDIGEMKGGIGSEGTFTWGGYFNTQYFADPNEDVIGILMKQTIKTQGDYTSPLFRRLVFQSIDD